jgi:hypothetical protein
MTRPAAWPGQFCSLSASLFQGGRRGSGPAVSSSSSNPLSAGRVGQAVIALHRAGHGPARRRLGHARPCARLLNAGLNRMASMRATPLPFQPPPGARHTAWPVASPCAPHWWNRLPSFAVPAPDMGADSAVRTAPARARPLRKAGLNRVASMRAMPLPF